MWRGRARALPSSRSMAAGITPCLLPPSNSTARHCNARAAHAHTLPPAMKPLPPNADPFRTAADTSGVCRKLPDRCRIVSGFVESFRIFRIFPDLPTSRVDGYRKYRRRRAVPAGSAAEHRSVSHRRRSRPSCRAPSCEAAEGSASSVGQPRRPAPSASSVGQPRRPAPSASSVGQLRRPAPSVSSVGQPRRPAPTFRMLQLCTWPC